MDLRGMNEDLAVGVGCFLMCAGIAIVIIAVAFAKWLIP